jgi:hypothetical protein
MGRKWRTRKYRMKKRGNTKKNKRVLKGGFKNPFAKKVNTTGMYDVDLNAAFRFNKTLISDEMKANTGNMMARTSVAMKDFGAKASAKTSVAMKDFGAKASTTMQDVGAKTSVAMKDFGAKASTTMQDVGAKTSAAISNLKGTTKPIESEPLVVENQDTSITEPVVVDDENQNTNLSDAVDIETDKQSENLTKVQIGGAVTYRKLFDTNNLVENSQFENTNNFIKFLSFIKQKQESGYELPEEIIKTIDSGKPYDDYSSPHLLFYIDNNTNDFKGYLFYDLNKTMMNVSLIFNMLDDVSQTLNDEVIKIIDTTPTLKTIKINNTNSNLIEKMNLNDTFKNSDENVEGYILFITTKAEEPKSSFFKNPFAKKQDAAPITKPEPNVVVNSETDKIKEVKDAFEIAISSIGK